jgi:H+-transporting ATPase
MSQPIVEKEAGTPAQSDKPVGDAPVSEKRVREYKDFGHDEVKPTRTFFRLAFLRVIFRA